MAKQGEIDYLMRIGEAGAKHAAGKPYSDVGCGSYLMQIGCIMSLLPQPPCRLLDAGCGTGWTSVLFARRGYDVVGVDISEDMIFHANMNKHSERVDNLHFVVCDYENMPFQLEFACAVFFDSLHHAVDEVEALRAAHRALRQVGICITSEPGTGHARKPEAQAAVRDFNVTDKAGSPAVVIVNEEFVQRYFPDRNAVGKRVRFGNNEDETKNPWWMIVGVVRDIRERGLLFACLALGLRSGSL